MLTTEDKRELTERGRKAGLGLDLWPETGAGARREDVLRMHAEVLSHRFNERYERELLGSAGFRPAWETEKRAAFDSYFSGLQGDPGPYTPIGAREMTPEEKRMSYEDQIRGMPGWSPYPCPGPPPVIYVNEFDLNETAEEWVEKWIPKSNWTRLKNLLRRMSPWYR